MLRRLCVVLAALPVASVLGAPPAAAYEPRYGSPNPNWVPAEAGLFNVPRPWGSSAEIWRLMRHVDRAIENTPGEQTVTDPATGKVTTTPGATILISTYLLDRDTSVDHLIDACRRGIAVRVILDENIENKNSRRLIATLNGDNPPDRNKDGIPDDSNGDGSPDSPRTGECGVGNPVGPATTSDPLTGEETTDSLSVPTEDRVTWGADRSYAKKCDGSCRGGSGHMHSKFYAFSQTGAAQDVVITSSANLNRGGALLGWNDMYTMVNQPATYQGYKAIHLEMTDDTQAGEGKVEIDDPPTSLSRFFPMKNASRANDPTIDDLNEVSCGPAEDRTRIYVSMFFWGDLRGNYIADKLLNLAREGCQVSLIYGAPTIQLAQRLRDAMRRGLVTLFDSRWDRNNDGWNEVRTHAKYIAINGRFNGVPGCRVTTGSQNWAHGSLDHGDEVTVTIKGCDTYRQYVQNWGVIRNHSRRPPPYWL